MADAEGTMKEMLTTKAHELFALCDRENKGFIGKRDMQRMLQELPLDPDQLEDVFDSLDVDGNGFLTLEEFTTGFGSFLGLEEDDLEDDAEDNEPQSSGDNPRRPGRRSGRNADDTGRTVIEEEEEEDEQFADFVVQAGATDLLGESEAALRQMWQRLQREEGQQQQQPGPALLETFSRLLKDIAARDRRAKSEQHTLETALRQQQETMQGQMKNMFEEMEAQIASEKSKNHHQEEQKQAKIREDLEAQVAVKELEAQMTRQKLAELTQQLEKVTSSDVQQRQEISQLQKQKDQYEAEVVRQQKMIAELQTGAEQNRAMNLEERRKRAQAAFSVTENIANEREDLVKQLDMLKSINARLLDERDSGLSPQKSTFRQEQGESLKGVTDQMSVQDRCKDANISMAVNSMLRPSEKNVNSGGLAVPEDQSVVAESDCEVDEVFFENNADVVQRVPVIPLSAAYKGPLPLARDGDSTSLMDELLEGADLVRPLPSAGLTPGAGSETDDTHTVPRHRRRHRSNQADRHHSSTLLIYHQGHIPKTDDPDSSTEAAQNGWPLKSGSPTPSAASTILQPQRVYKVVIIGDAGVGKSSFVQRSCTGEVRPSYAATIGVDFQVQTVVVEDQTVCIQLWDTAGQERFRSITKQYFRKADGVFIMFDVTSETSFRNCRQWIQDVKDLSAEETSLILLGNKTDLCPDAELRVVKPQTGATLASDCGAFYQECSALQDVGVSSVIELMAELLLQREDVSLERALTLVPETAPKKRCCKK